MSKLIEWSPEQGMLLDIAARTLRERWTIDQVRAGLEDGPGYDEALWQEMQDLGWNALSLPEELDGAAQPVGALVPLVEPMGRHLVSGPFVDTQCAVQGLLAAQDGECDDCTRWLERAGGGAALALALFEEDGSWEVDEPKTTLRQGVLDGVKCLVNWAGSADGFVVSARDEEGALCLIWMDEQLAPASRDEQLIDLTQRSARLVFEGVAIGDSLVVRGESARRALRAIRSTAWLLHAAVGVGAAQGALDVLLEYLRSRRQFGRTIGSYQSLKHPTVDALIAIERARSHLYHAATVATRVDPASDDATLAAALRTALLTACEALLFVADRAVQFHGGVGFTWECDAQLFLRRAMWLQSRWGDPAHHRQHLAELLLP